MKKLFILIVALLLTSCGNTLPGESTVTPLSTETITAPEVEETKKEIKPINKSETENMTVVSTVDYSLISDETFETVTLYTSATKENGRFVWDDHARWVLEVTSDSGAIFKLCDTEVTNGSIYFDILEIDSQKFILLRNISTAANYTKTYTFEEGKLYETNEPDMNEMKNTSVNLIFTSVPKYR